MTDPLICCICPAHREEFLDRAIRCYREQTYESAFFLILDNANPHLNDRNHPWEDVIHIPLPEMNGKTVGALRNSLVRMSKSADATADVIAHFDDDDWSAPERLQYQFDFMRSTGVPVVGFNDMLFYDSVRDRVLYYDSRMTNYALGTSLFYKREAWERVKFPDITPEDTTWQHQVGHDNIRGCSSIVDGKPMMIQVLHGANAAASASGAIFEPATKELDAEVRRILSVA